MNILIICRDGLYTSLINSLSLAILLQKNGEKVKVIFTGEALYGLCNNTIIFPYSLSGVEIKKTISEKAALLGLSLQSDRDPKLIDIKKLLIQTKESGVQLWACPIWSTLLKLESKLPQGISHINIEKLLDEINSSDKIIGTL